MFYNASAWQKAESEELKNVLRFVYESRADSDYTKALETARKLLAEGIPLATVLKCTGLTEEDLKN